ncbi:MAG: TetR/AcrR family transcriptional regulator [Promethearchaeota archaeon]
MLTKDLSLRERKYALTKFAILNSTIDKLHDRALSKIKVSEICSSIPISEVTFYNYFPKKSDIILFFMQLWSIELIWHIKKKRILPGLKFIEEIFEFNAEVVRKSPNIMAEILIMIAQNRGPIEFKELKRAERLLFAQKLNCSEEIQEKDLKDNIIPILQIAIDQGELPKDVDLETVFDSILTILYGVPMSIKYTNFTDMHKKIQSMYRVQLRNLWQILRLKPRS